MAVFHTTMFSNALHRWTEMTAIIPVDKDDGAPLLVRSREELPLKTVMLLHGFSGTHSDWLYGSRIQQLAISHHVAVLCPCGENSFYIDDTKRDALYEAHLCEVLDFSRKVFPLSTKAGDTVIGGFSMGGYGALLGGLKHPELFGGILALSSALITDHLSELTEYPTGLTSSADYYEHTFGRPQAIAGSSIDPRHLVKQLLENGQPIPRIFMACGSEDFLVESNDNFSAYLNSLGIEHTYVKKPGVHDWVFWDAHIETGLDHFFGVPVFDQNPIFQR